MSGKRRTPNFITLVIAAVILATLLIAGQKFEGTKTTNPTPSDTVSIASSTSPEASTSTSSSPSASPSSTPTIQAVTEYDLIAYTETKNAGQIIKVNLKTKKSTVLFTDSGESLKIKQVGNITSDGSKIVTVLGAADADFGGSLWLISLDGSSNKTKVTDTFSSPWPPTISPDGQTIAFVSYSNAERDGGYSIQTISKDGTGLKTILKESNAITRPVFNNSGTHISYVKQSSSIKESIIDYNLSTKKGTEVTSINDKVPYDLDLSQNGNYAFIEGTGANAHVYQIESGQTNISHIADSINQASHPVYDLTGNWIAFVSNGTIDIYDQTTKNIQSYGSAQIVLGWVRRT